MFRTDDLLLAHLVLRRSPRARAAVRATLARNDSTATDSEGKSPVARRFMKAKLLAPADFVAMTQVIALSKRRCGGCSRPFIAFPGTRERRVRCGRCRARTLVAPWNGTGPAPVRSAARAARSATLPEAPSQKIGPYAIESVIAQGGMGIVYRAYDPRTKRRVALKVLRGDATADMASRFKREAEAIARLRHPGIVQVHDVGIDQLQRYFTMDLVEGDDLEKDLENGKLALRDVVQVIVEVADGLEHAHERGIIHRDVKPQNILVEREGQRAKLTDFGLARDLARSALTDDGDLIGTPFYMAPEQLEGASVDRRTDVYALGLVLYRGLAGSLPFSAKTIFELKEKVLHEPPVAPSLRRPEVPVELDRIVKKAIEKLPQDRYETAALFAKDLRAWQRGAAVSARPVSPLVKAARVAKRYRGLAAAIATGLVLAGAGLALYDARRKANDADAARALAESEAIGRVNAAITRSGVALEEGRAALARGEALVARTRLDDSVKGIEEARAALAGAPADLRRDLETKLKGSERVARRTRLEARLALESEGLGGRESQRQVRDEATALLADDPRDADTLVVLARAELESDRLAPAIEALGRAITVDAARLDAYFLRGEAHRRAGRAEFARMDLARALGEGAPADAKLRSFGRDEVLVARARARLGEGDREGALRDLDEAAKLCPDLARGGAPRSASVHSARAELSRAQGDDESALRELSLACSLAPRRADLLRARGEVQAALGDRERALADLDAALALDARDRAAAVARARLRALALETDGAEEDLALALAVGPDDPPNLPALDAARLVAARLRRTERNLDEALGLLAAVVKATPRPTASDLAAHLERAEVLVERASLKPASGGAPNADDVIEAAREIELSLTASPSSVRALRAAARLALARRNAAQARVHLERALELEPRDGAVRALYAKVLLALGEKERAAAELAHASRLQREETRTPSLLGVSTPEDEARELAAVGRRLLVRSSAAGSPDRALKAFQRGVALAPELSALRVGLVEALARRGGTEEALKELDRALVEAPPLVEEHLLRARLLFAKGELDEPAIEAYGVALGMLPKDQAHAVQRATIHLERGKAHLRGGDARRSLPDLDEACALDPVALDAFVARARAHDKLGEDALAAKDRERVALLEGGYRGPVMKLVREAMDSRVEGMHHLGPRIIGQGFDLVPRSDVQQRATLYYWRAFFSARDLELGRAVADLAGMIELDAGRFRDVFDEVQQLPDTIKVDTFIAEGQSLVHDREPDPDFFEGFAAYVRVERSAEYRADDVRTRAARAGVQALGRFLDRNPLHPSALTLRALLAPLCGLNANALRDARDALEVSPGLGAAEYAIFRVYSARRDRDEALAHLDAALRGRFNAWSTIDRDLAGNEDPRFRRVVSLARGRDTLEHMRRIESLGRPLKGKESQAIYQDGLNFGKTGVATLAALVRADDAEARAITAAIRLAHGRCARRLGDATTGARELVAALETAPASVAALWREFTNEARELARVAPAWGQLGAPPPGDDMPGLHFQRIGRDLIFALAGEPRRKIELDGAKLPLLVARSVLRLASSDIEGALADARDPRLAAAAPLTADLLAARAEAARGRNEDALRLLARVVAGGVPGNVLKDDTVLEKALGGDPDFRRLRDGS